MFCFSESRVWLQWRYHQNSIQMLLENYRYWLQWGATLSWNIWFASIGLDRRGYKACVVFLWFISLEGDPKNGSKLSHLKYLVKGSHKFVSNISFVTRIMWDGTWLIGQDFWKARIAVLAADGVRLEKGSTESRHCRNHFHCNPHSIYANLGVTALEFGKLC